MAASALPPGPSSPAMWQLLHYTQSPLSFLEKCHQKYGDPFTIRLAGFGTFVMLTDPAAVQDVFRGTGDQLHSGEGNQFFSVTVGKSSVLVLDGEPHARQRRVLLPPLKGERMRSFFEAMQLATLQAVRGWPMDEPIRMLDPMQNITLRVMLEVVLGLRSPEQIELFAGKIRRMLAYGRSRYALLAMPLPLHRLNYSWMPFFRQVRDFDQSLYALITEQRDLAPMYRGDNVLADLLAATHEDGTPLSDAEIRDAIITLLIAGHDTTAIALAWALEQIVPRADVVEQIVAELREVTGGASPKPDQLNELKYLDAAIRESLRIRPIVPFVVRLTKVPFTAGGREYPPGVLLSPCVHLVHRRADLYAKPEEFRPERFIERKYAAHEWFPFGGGTRMCLGMAFAMYELKVVLSTLFATVQMARPARAHSKPVRVGITLAPSDGAKIIVTPKPE